MGIAELSRRAAAGALCGAALVAATACTSTGPGGGPRSGSGNTAHPPTADVRVTDCAVDGGLGLPAAGLTVTNHSSRTSEYAISVEFTDTAGNRLTVTAAAVADLGPGHTARQTARGVRRIHGPVECRVMRVERIAAPD